MWERGTSLARRGETNRLTWKRGPKFLPPGNGRHRPEKKKDFNLHTTEGGLSLEKKGGLQQKEETYTEGQKHPFHHKKNGQLTKRGGLEKEMRHVKKKKKKGKPRRERNRNYFKKKNALPDKEGDHGRKEKQPAGTAVPGGRRPFRYVKKGELFPSLAPEKTGSRTCRERGKNHAFAKKERRRR